MKRLCKTKLGFTLIEMIVVIAIIVILASVLFLATANYIKQANTVKRIVSSKNSSFASANSGINNSFIDLGY
jgi:prepilin-type N-terminal cleavage/methylation domain-containing protein